MTFGSTLKQLRKKKGINQELLAKRIGVTQTYLSLLESGRKTPSINLLNSLSDELEIPASVLGYLSLNKENINNDRTQSFEKLNPLIEELIQQLILNEENS